VHYEPELGACGRKRKPLARISKHASDVTCRQCVYRLWARLAVITDFDPRITPSMRQYRIDTWRRAGLLAGRL
jgi:hypothetical protein